MSVEVTSLNEVSLQNLGTLSVHIDVGEMGCVPDDVFMIPSSNAGERHVAVHTATRQYSCVRDLEGGVFETNSFFGMLFNDGRQHESNSTPGGTSDINIISDHPGRCSSSTQSRRTAGLGPGQ